jgi:phosphoribosylformimino-5-aminoimidazole carboxamide ribonucleotide (ProFAR) isomerase
MIVIPTAELRGSLVYAPATQHGPASRTPVDVATTHRAFAALGFRQVHLHDIDAESGSEQNEALIAEIARDASVDVLVSGGAISVDRVDRLIDVGVSQLILGRNQNDDIDSLAGLADSFPGRLIVRADVANLLSGRRNARRQSSSDMVDVATELSGLPLGGLAVHGLSSDGFPGAPLRFVEDLVEASDVPVFCRTEVTSIGELRALENLGIAATVLGSSLFDGRLDAEAVAHHFEP